MRVSHEGLSNAPRLVFTPVKHNGVPALRVRDNYAGIVYVCAAARHDGRLGLSYLALEVDGGRLIEDPEVRQLRLDSRQLAVWAERVALDGRVPAGAVDRTFTWSGSVLFQDRKRERAPKRETPSLQWVADLTRECRAAGAPARSTVAQLAAVNASTVDRWIARAVEAGLLDRQPAHRPRTSTPTSAGDPDA